jgi:hypothetical protein
MNNPEQSQVHAPLVRVTEVDHGEKNSIACFYGKLQTLEFNPQKWQWEGSEGKINLAMH